MADILAWLIAYIIAGFLYVRRDLSQPARRQPGYVDSAKGRWLVRLTWLLVTFRMLFWMGRFQAKYAREEALPSYLTFAVLGFVGAWIV